METASGKSLVRSLCHFLSEMEAIRNAERADHVQNLPVTELQEIIDSHFNSMLVLDWDVLEGCMLKVSTYYTFLNGLRSLSSERGEFVMIVSEKSKAEL